MKRTHTVDLYRPDYSGEEKTYPSTPTASEIDCNIQPRGGELELRLFGETVFSRHQGFFPAGTDVQEGDALLVTDGVGPDTLEVAFVGEQGGKWDVECDLIKSGEDLTP